MMLNDERGWDAQVWDSGALPTNPDPDSDQGSKWEKINAGMVALPSYPSSPQASAILVTDRCKHQRPVA